MEKIYNPTFIEDKWRKFWEQQDCFKVALDNNDLDAGSKHNFCIVLPPPNITGNLHMGHAFQHTIMDVLIRFNKMSGSNTLWQAGLDHAGISTQMVVERQLSSQGIDRNSLTRVEFIDKVFEWKNKYASVITSQMQRLGTAIDWSIARFTLDSEFSAVVKKVFIALYEEGLIYKGKKLVNWDPVLQTAISDLEVVTEEVPGCLWYIKYQLADPLSNSGDNYITIATTRPETLLGDVAVAVNPSDDRYKNLIGKKLIVPIVNRKIPIIADEYVDPNFGTGCLKVTPAHDPNDYAIAIRHKLPLINIFTKAITLNDSVPLDYRGLDKLAAREKVLESLQDNSLLVKITDCLINIPKSTSTNAIVEPFLTDQWFMRMTELAQPAIQAVKTKLIKFFPEEWANNYLDWLNNIQDWCISRQLWWGHQIPVWYDSKGNLYAATNESEVRKKYNLSNDVTLTQENDVLDTWFSAGLWPFVTLGWPNNMQQLEKFFPTNVLVTGFDIIFFWVARMVMFSLKFTGKIPFKHVYIHGIIQDQDGQKMSKTRGNVIDPIDLIDGISLTDLIAKRTTGLMQPHLKNSIEKKTKQQFPNGINNFGTDALRFTFCAIATHSRHIKFEFFRLESYRNFCNKLWNAARFVFLNLAENHIKRVTLDEVKLDLSKLFNNSLELSQEFNNNHKQVNYNYLIERWILSVWQEVKINISNYIINYRFDLAIKSIYEFVWDEYCDWYLEFVKYYIKDFNLTKQVLVFTLDELLKVLHPFIPYITEEIWETLQQHSFIEDTNFRKKNIHNKSQDILINQRYPEYNKEFVDLHAVQTIEWIKTFITAVRNLRANMNISPKIRFPKVFINANLPSLEKSYLIENKDIIKAIAKVDAIVFTDDATTKDKAMVAVVNTTEIWVPTIGVIDYNLEKSRITKEINKLSKQLLIVDNKLNNPEYLNNAPRDIIAKEKNKQKELITLINKLKTNLISFP